MWEDPIIKELRNTRHEIEAECGDDFEEIFMRAVEIQNGYRDRIISKPQHPKQEVESVSLERV